VCRLMVNLEQKAPKSLKGGKNYAAFYRGNRWIDVHDGKLL
jgi:hypothetical protein